MTVAVKPQRALGRLSRFVAEHALPLWAGAGFDETAQAFHERLMFSGEPMKETPRRLMVQARQIVVYARAHLAQWSPGGRLLASRAFENACRRYRSQDEGPGWIFSVLPDGEPIDRTHDLYTYAFVLYMLAWLYRLDGDASILALADDTLLDIDRIFSCGGEPMGFLSKVPGPTNRREQNPHMHLFEALLSLAEATGRERFLARAGSLVQLFDGALADPVTGTARETFNENWIPDRASGENLLEPGHQMEWVWLLREWERLSGRPVDNRVGLLIAHATRHGIDCEKGLVRNIVTESGGVVSDASRVWPQTEAIRALCREDGNGEAWPNLVSDITDGLFRTHLPAHLNGGWIDQVDRDGVAAVDYMPASTLYHLAGAVLDGAACFTRPGG
jgi:mannose/cellobiose epimerase-like protein (N-acyl-D-glucosamine 2-epimerase family)